MATLQLQKLDPIRVTDFRIEQEEEVSESVTSGQNQHRFLSPQTTTDPFLRSGSQNVTPLASPTDDVFDDDGFEYPEHNTKGWLVVFGAFVGLIPTWGIANSMGVLQTQILENQLANVDTTTVSWIFSINTCLCFICTILSGTYFDRNGTKWPILIGSILSVGSLVALGNSEKLYQFILSFGVCYGIGNGLVVAPTIGAVSHYFPKKQRATAIGMAGTGGCVGGVLFPVMLRKTYISIGFKWSMRLVALIDLVCLIVAFALVKERKLAEKTPMSLQEKAKLYLLKSFDLNGLISDKRYLFNVLGCLFAEMTVVITSSYFSFICVKQGFTESEAFLFVTVINVLAVFGRYLSGIAADKWFGSFNIIITLLITTGIADLVIWLPFKSKAPALWAYSVFYGFFYGGIFSLIPNCCSQVVRADIFGSRYATMYAVAGLCFLGFIPASSAIIGNGLNDSRNDGFIVLMSVVSFLSAGFYFLVRCMSVGMTLRKF